MKTKKNNFSRELATACALSLVVIMAIGVVNAQGTPAATVVLKNFSFDPQVVEISEGQSVTWINEDNSYHRMVGDNNEFESSILATGENYTLEFNLSGNYSYHCSIHPSMTASIVVLANGTESNATNPIINQTTNESANETNQTAGNQTGNVTIGNQTTNQTTPPVGISQLTIEIGSSGFEPQNLTIYEGDTVEWVNMDSINHKMESDEFNSPDIPAGASYYFAFKIAGNYSYTDVYTNMTGHIIVLAGSNQTTNETSPNGNQTTNQTNATRHVQTRHIVKFNNNAFDPQVINGYVGDMVEWFNEENATHKINSDAFNSLNMTIGDAYAFVFDTPGTYGYSDGLYPDAMGTIVILPIAKPSDNTSQTPSDEGAIVRVEGFSFKPSVVTINKGETVTWINEDAVYHQIKGNGFNLLKFGQGETISLKMEESGIYNYRCTLHPAEKGQIIVN